MTRGIRTVMVVVLSVVLSGAGCSTIQNINLYSTQEEVQLGNQFDKEIRNQMDMLGDARLDSFIDLRGQQLVAHSKRKDIKYHFTVVNDETVNAFAIPGGYCYVNVGLFRKSETEAELISVISHEINHVVNEHSMKRLSQMQLLGAVQEAALGNSGTVANVVANLFTSTGMLYYSREAEREADYDGLITMYEAGYNPRGMVEMFKMLKQGRESEPSAWENLFSTHPMTDERIANAQQLIDQLPEKDGLIWNSPEWDDIISYLREKYPPPENAS